MTFTELQNRIGSDIIESDFHKHPNGGGWVHNAARVDVSAYVEENAIVVSGDAWVSDNAWEKSPLFIIGTRHSLTNAKRGHIQIGRHLKPIDWWRENFRDIGKKEGYSPEEIEEYGAYIELFKKIGK